MDVKYVNPFIESFRSVMPQLGFSNIKIGKFGAKLREITCSGVVIVLGFVGNIKGNVVYRLGLENAKTLASTMMMGMGVEEFDDIAKSALSELANMLTANAATFFSNMGIAIEISTPTLLEGVNMTIKMSSIQILSIEMLTDDIPIEINLSFDR